jgi:hypothetical protein
VKKGFSQYGRAGHGQTSGATRTSYAAPIPGGEFRYVEFVDGTYFNDWYDAPVLASCFSPVVPPDDVQDNSLVRGIEMMIVIDPATRSQVNLHAAGPQFSTIEKDERVSEIWTEPMAPGSAMDDLY